jgi:hypothetical protein
VVPVWRYLVRGADAHQTFVTSVEPNPFARPEVWRPNMKKAAQRPPFHVTGSN